MSDHMSDDHITGILKEITCPDVGYSYIEIK